MRRQVAVVGGLVVHVVQGSLHLPTGDAEAAVAVGDGDVHRLAPVGFTISIFSIFKIKTYNNFGA